MLNVIPLISQNIRITFNSKYSVLTRIDCAWVIFQSFTFFPLAFFLKSRFQNQIPNEKFLSPSTPFPATFVETYIKFNTLMFLIFYVPQTVLRLFLGLDQNNVLLILHHFATFYGVYVFLKVPYYPWFTIGPLAFHSLLLVMPTATYLYYPYIILILICWYGLGLPPYNKRKWYNQIRYYIIGLSAVLILMWAVGFTNEIEIR